MNIQRRIFGAVCTVYFTLCLLAFIWPMALIGHQVDPKIFGIPFFFVWNIAIVVMIFVGCAAMYLWDMALGRKEQSRA